MKVVYFLLGLLFYTILFFIAIAILCLTPFILIFCVILDFCWKGIMLKLINKIRHYKITIHKKFVELNRVIMYTGELILNRKWEELLDYLGKEDDPKGIKIIIKD